jgi:hypothetical protein
MRPNAEIVSSETRREQRINHVFGLLKHRNYSREAFAFQSGECSPRPLLRRAAPGRAVYLVYEETASASERFASHVLAGTLIRRK